MKRGNLTNLEMSLVASAVTRYGNSCHPLLNRQTLPYFTESYVLNCLRKAEKSVTEKGAKVLKSAITKIERSSK